MAIKQIVMDLSEEGATSQTDVSGTPFVSSPLAPFKIVNKKKKKKYKLEEIEADDDPEFPDDLDDYEFETEEDLKECEKVLNVEKRGDRWCVVHGHPMKPGSKTDKPIGSVIKCFPTKAEADRMHKAIIISQIKRKKMHEIVELFSPITAPEIKKFNELNEAIKHLK